MAKILLTTALALGMVGLVAMATANEDKPKHTIEEVMKKAHAGKDSLFKKVSEGKASDDEKKELLALYEDLGKNKPEKGEAESWKTKTEVAVKAAKAAVKGEEGSEAKLKEAINCKACHDVHK